MTIAELKEQVLSGKITDSLLIFVCSENYYLADQYINTIAAKTGLEKKIITSITQRDSPILSLVIDYSNYLYVLKTEVFDEMIPDPEDLKNVIIVCNRIDKKIIDNLTDYIIDFPKLLDWQIKDYMKTICPGLDSNTIDWAYASMSGDIYKIKNELDKIKLFPVAEQQNILTEIRFSAGSDMYSQTLYGLAEAIIRNNKREVLEYLHYRQSCDIDPFGLISILLSNYKKILFVTQRSGLTAADIGITDKLYKAISYYYRGYFVDKLKTAIKVLSALDLDLKSGRLDMPKNMLFDYIVGKLLD